MEKVINFGGQQIPMRASALVPRLYRFKFCRDMMSDMRALQKSMENVLEAKKAGDDTADLTLDDLTIFENVAYIMAKHAAPAVPSDPEEWLDSLEGVFSIYAALPEMLELWGLNNLTTSVPVKK